MKILAFSDLHDEEAAFESLSNFAPKFDFVFACGDLTISVSFAERILAEIPNCYVITGNWDNESVNRFLESKKQFVHEKRIQLTDSELNVVGFGFSNPTPYGTFGELSEEEIYGRMSKLHIDSNTLLMLHCPPKGYFDHARGRPIGSESILKIIEEKKPFAAFFGHVHAHQGVQLLGPTTLIKLPPANEFRAASIEITNKSISVQFISL
ncbi:metallophosphoesterase family protein [Candidatus Micrarchaeota archaeon]|nr:metallophosphoesterase family protein [Candidatus Micrarchaeota archaeon]